jgi:hypothetical protein
MQNSKIFLFSPIFRQNMQKQSKVIAVFAFAALIAGIAVATTMEQVQAQQLNPTHPDVSRLSPKSFGSATGSIVCGDQLCAGETPRHNFDVEGTDNVAPLSKTSDDAPHVEVISIERYQKNTNQRDAITYKIIFSMTAGTSNLRDIHLEVESDVDKQEFVISSLNSLKSSVNVIRIKALDQDSITGEITGFSFTGPTGGADR